MDASSIQMDEVYISLYRIINIIPRNIYIKKKVFSYFSKNTCIKNKTSRLIWKRLVSLLQFRDTWLFIAQGISLQI